MTNAEKFKEVFGFEPDLDAMVVQCPNADKNETCKYQWAMGRCHCEEWWQEEYKGHDV